MLDAPSMGGLEVILARVRTTALSRFTRGRLTKHVVVGGSRQRARVEPHLGNSQVGGSN